MRKMFKKPHDIMLYRERTEEQEFGLPQKDYRQCQTCKAIYHDKSWHHGKGINPASLLGSHHKLWLTRCPACKMIGEHQYEGIVVIESIPRKYQNELFHMINGYGLRAYKKDCQHRIIAITKEEQAKWIVMTTENQLAAKLGKKIKEVFDKVEVKTSYSTEPDDVERVFVKFRPYLSFMPEGGEKMPKKHTKLGLKNIHKVKTRGDRKVKNLANELYAELTY